MKGAMSVDILRWAMNQADSGDTGQGAKWAKYIQYRPPHDHRATVYFATNTVVVPLEDDQEPVALEVEEDAVAMIVRAPEPGHRSMPIELDSDEELETVVRVEEKIKTEAKVTRHSNRLQGPQG
ncbi:Acyl-CoA-binding domain-containing protein 4 [Hordeum vulgare]|nr:Acyl-CoA-binding domain-containing protein 4 [Hordeum vulgare]